MYPATISLQQSYTWITFCNRTLEMKEQKKLLAALFLKTDLPLVFVSDFEWPIFCRMEDG